MKVQWKLNEEVNTDFKNVFTSGFVVLLSITIIIPIEIWHCALLKYSYYHDNGGDDNRHCDNNGTNHHTASNDNNR